MQSRSQLRRLRNSFRHNLRNTTRNLHEFGQVVQDSNSLKNVRARLRKVPVWLKICRKIYHKYGLKHLLLIMVFVLYQFLGACVFLFLEEKAEEDKETAWKLDVAQNRTKLIDVLINSFFNNSKYLFFLTPEQSTEIYDLLNDQLGNYTANYKQMTDQKIQWDFWNAMLYAGTVCTTIGYGHLFPRTDAGRFATMVYAIFGIPLVLTILDDLGKLLTLGLKYPWLGFKMLIRRVFRHCTGQTLVEIQRIDEEDKKWLPVFDLPIPVAIGVVVAWIFICSATFCIWEKDWNYFVAFYFFFVSLTTIGLGDIVPSQPKYLLMLFGYIIIGLSLVAMCVNLIQARLERTYEAGRDEADLTDAEDAESASANLRRMRSPPPPTPAVAALAMTAASRVTLGILRANSISSYSLSSVNTKSPTRGIGAYRRQTSNKVCQTLLSIASPKLLVDDDDDETPKRGRHHLVPASISLDDVMKLVDTEEQDLYILSQLCGDRSEANLVQNIDNGLNDQDGFMDDDWQALLLPTTTMDNESRRVQVHRQPSSVSSRVHFRSSISLIPHSNDQLTSFAGHIAQLAQMDSSSLKSPDREEAKIELEKPRSSFQSEDGNETEISPLAEIRLKNETVSSAPASGRRWGLRLGFGHADKKSDFESKRKTSFVDNLKKRFSHSQPPIVSGATSRPKRMSPINRRGLANNRAGTSIEVQRASDDEADDNDTTPLEPKAPRHF